MVNPRTNLKTKQLVKLLSEPNAHVSLKKYKRHIALSPNALFDINGAIHSHLNLLVTRYDAELDAVILGFRNINILTNLGTILHDAPHIHLDIELEYFLFNPVKGSILSGVVTKKSRDNIGCLVHNIFNASIPINLEDGVDVDNINIGEQLLFSVELVDFSKSLPYIRGKLVDSQEGLQTVPKKKKKRKSSVDHQIHKKIKSEKINSEEESESDNFTMNLNTKHPTSILRKSGAFGKESSPSRRISFYGDLSHTSNKTVKERNFAIENRSEKFGREGNENILGEETTKKLKKAKKSTSTIVNELQEPEENFQETEQARESFEFKIKKKKKAKGDDKQSEIYNNKMWGVKDSNDFYTKKLNEMQFLENDDLEESVEINHNVSKDETPIVQKSKKKIKKDVSLNNRENLEIATQEQFINEQEPKPKKFKKHSNKDMETGEVISNALQLNELKEQTKRMKKREKSNPGNEVSESVDNEVRSLPETIKDSPRKKKRGSVENSEENIVMHSEEKGISLSNKLDKPAKQSQKAKKERKKVSELLEPEFSSIGEDGKGEDKNVFEKKKKKEKREEHPALDIKAKKREKEENNDFTNTIIPSHSNKVQKLVGSFADSADISLSPDDGRKKKIKKSGQKGEASLNESFESKPRSVANSTLISGAEPARKKSKYGSNCDMSFDFLSPIKKSDAPLENIPDGVQFVSSTQSDSKKEKVLSHKTKGNNLAKQSTVKVPKSDTDSELNNSFKQPKAKNTSKSPKRIEGLVTTSQIETGSKIKTSKIASTSLPKSPNSKNIFLSQNHEPDSDSSSDNSLEPLPAIQKTSNLPQNYKKNTTLVLSHVEPVSKMNSSHNSINHPSKLPDKVALHSSDSDSNSNSDSHSPFSQTNNSPFKNCEGFVTSTQIETVSKVKQSSKVDSSPSKSSDCNISFPKPNPEPDSDSDTSCESLAQSSKSPKSTNTQIKSTSKMKNSPNLSKLKSPSRSPKSKVPFDNTNPEVDNGSDSSNSESPHHLKEVENSPISRNNSGLSTSIEKETNHSSRKASQAKKIVQNPKRKSPISCPDPKSDHQILDYIGLKHQGGMSSKSPLKIAKSYGVNANPASNYSSDSSSSLDTPNLTSAKHNVSVNTLVNEMTKQKKKRKEQLKPAGSDSSSTESDTTPMDQKKVIPPVENQTERKSMLPREMPESDETTRASIDLDLDLDTLLREDKKRRQILGKPPIPLHNNYESDRDSSDSDHPSRGSIAQKERVSSGSSKICDSDHTGSTLPLAAQTQKSIPATKKAKISSKTELSSKVPSKTASVKKRTKEKSGSDEKNASDTDTLVKGLLQKIQYETIGEPEASREEKVTKVSKKNSKPKGANNTKAGKKDDVKGGNGNPKSKSSLATKLLEGDEKNSRDIDSLAKELLQKIKCETIGDSQPSSEEKVIKVGKKNSKPKGAVIAKTGKKNDIKGDNGNSKSKGRGLSPKSVTSITTRLQEDDEKNAGDTNSLAKGLLQKIKCETVENSQASSEEKVTKVSKKNSKPKAATSAKAGKKDDVKGSSGNTKYKGREFSPKSVTSIAEKLLEGF